MRRPFFVKSLFGSLLVTSMSVCTAPDLAAPCQVPPGATAAEALAAKQQCYGAVQPTLLDPRLRKDIDILFVIDNSPSMSPKQKVLAAAIPQFIAAIEDTRSDYHVGIVTTDLGFNTPDGTTTGVQFPGTKIAACNTAAGDDGVLQNQPCTSRSGLSSEAAAACATLCPDPKYLPQGGARYISKFDGVSNVPSKLMGGKDVGPQLAFQCLSLVGDAGCGVEQPLEAAKRALDNHRADNKGFNRGSSVLAVIFITDEDDCSVPPLNRALLNPATPNATSASCASPAQEVDGQCYSIDYRCMAKDLTCSEPMNTPGAKTNCKERTDSFLSSIDSYAKFFAGLPNPQVVVAGIWSPTLLDNLSADPTRAGRLVVDYVNGSTDSAGLNRGRRTSAACYNPDTSLTSDPGGFFGQAQLRLSSFIRRFTKQSTSEHSICDAQNYPSALSVIADNIAKSLLADCLRTPPKVTNGTPECVVGYVDAGNPYNTPDTLLPACSAKCCDYFATDSAPNQSDDGTLTINPHRDAKVAACSGQPDCYCAVPSQLHCGDGVVAGVWRPDNAPPRSGKIVNFQCAVAVPGA